MPIMSCLFSFRQLHVNITKWYMVVLGSSVILWYLVIVGIRRLIHTSNIFNWWEMSRIDSRGRIWRNTEPLININIMRAHTIRWKTLSWTLQICWTTTCTFHTQLQTHTYTQGDKDDTEQTHQVQLNFPSLSTVNILQIMTLEPISCCTE